MRLRHPHALSPRGFYLRQTGFRLSNPFGAQSLTPQIGFVSSTPFVGHQNAPNLAIPPFHSVEKNRRDSAPTWRNSARGRFARLNSASVAARSGTRLAQSVAR